jgi:glycosyltransferase involved in cell wall biosynthesis
VLPTTGGGQLVPPNDPIALAAELERLLLDHDARWALGQAGQARVHAEFNADAMATDVWDTWQRYLVPR